MEEKGRVAKESLSHPEIIADLRNGIFFRGDKIVLLMFTMLPVLPLATPLCIVLEKRGSRTPLDTRPQRGRM